MSPRLHRLLRIGSSLGSSLLLQARNLIISVIIFRAFADPDLLWGTVTNVLAVVTLLALPAKFGLEFTVVHFVSKHREKRPDQAVQALRTATALRVLLTALVTLPMLLFPRQVGLLTGLADVPALVQIGGLVLVTSSSYEYASFLLSSTDNFPAMLVTRLVYTVVNIGLIAWVAAQAWADPASPVLLAQVAGGAAATCWAWIAIRRDIRRLLGHVTLPVTDLWRARIDGRPIVPALLAFSIPMTLSVTANQLFNYIDRVLVGPLAGREALGHYAIANSVAAAALFATYAFRNVARAQLPALRERGGDDAKNALQAHYRASFVVAAWICAGFVTVGPGLLVAVYGPKVEPAAAMLLWFVPWVLLSAHSNFSATALVAAERPRAYAVLMGVMAAWNVLLNLALIPRFGGYGAILASIFTLLPMSAIAYREVARSYDPDLWRPRAILGAVLPGIRIAGLATVAGACAWPLARPEILPAIAGGAVLSIVFLLLLWLSGDLRSIRAAM